jgi:catechol 2,3-dioxygenase
VLGLRAPTDAGWCAADGRLLVQLDEVPGARPMLPQGRLGLYHYALLLPSRADLGRFLRHLESLGVPWGASDHLVSEAIYLTDPDGLTVEVYADRPRATWVREGQNLVATLDPLDRDSLVAEAGAPIWDGAPAGTIMGHQHFFIGDLALAERHYVGVLGFDVMSRLLRGALFVSAGGYHHHLGLNVWAAHMPVAGPGDAGLTEWSLRLGSADELSALRSRLESAHVAWRAEGTDVRVTDPWGITARISA